MKLISHITTTLCFSLALSAHAGDKFGNGGHGVVTNNGIMLLDFIEEGIEDIVALPSSPSYEAFVHQTVKTRIPFVNSEAVADKLSELSEIDTLLGALAYNALSAYRWKLIDWEQHYTHDARSPLKFEAGDKVQVATRNGAVVRITREYWNRMPEAHQVGLILHEILYGLTVAAHHNIPDSRIARAVNAVLFGDASEQSKYNSTLNLARGVLPLHPINRKNQVFRSDHEESQNFVFLRPLIIVRKGAVSLLEDDPVGQAYENARKNCEDTKAGETIKIGRLVKRKVVRETSVYYRNEINYVGFNYKPQLMDFEVRPVHSPGNRYKLSMPMTSVRILQENPDNVHISSDDTMKGCIQKVVTPILQMIRDAKKKLGVQ